MDIKTVKSERVCEEYYTFKHKSGLTVYIYPKKGYNSAYAIFGTAFGSVNTAFSFDERGKLTVPDGIAHYLEHKLFESEDGDAFSKYAETGANANAYTSFDKTCYLFSCTDKFKESFEILLDFVRSPYFTEETVAKEQGIIGQEIKMYDDSPDWRVMFNLLLNMYSNHPVKNDIAGTVETIAKITPEALYDCYNAYYSLSNMALCVVGKADKEEIISILDKKLTKPEKVEVKSYFPEESDGIVSDYTEYHLPVGVPLFNLGFKENAEHRMTTKEMAETDILLSILASSTSELYKILQDKGLINQTFSYEIFEGPHYNATIFSGESRDPEKVAKIIREYIKSVKENGISREDFEISKKAIYGDAVSSLNSVEAIGNILMDFHFSGKDLFGYIDAVANVSPEDAERRLSEMLFDCRASLSVIR